MARIESVAVAGYYPAPARLLSNFASTLRLRLAEHHRYASPILLLDPCAGEGDAIAGLCEAWRAATPDARFVTHAYEIEGQRAARLKQRFSFGSGHVERADAFCLRWTGSGAGIVWCNPPYDTDPVHGRLEHRFLLHFTPALSEGDGFLLLLTPGHALQASAEHLSQEFTDLRCWRLPEPEYSAYGQVLVVGRRVEESLPPNEEADRILEWARHPEQLPVLEEVCSSPLVAELGNSYSLNVTVQDLDVGAAAHRFRPWQGTALGLDKEVGELMGAQIRAVLPPKPAHISLAMAAGQFNGRELRPNDPDRYPSILAKGVFRREIVPVEEKRNKKGKLTSTVVVERPRLDLCVLDLSSYRYHRLKAGVEPSRSEDLSQWNAADVIVQYDRGLAELLKRQFPPIHDPTDPQHDLALPALARAPFPAQAHAIRAAIKLLAMGQNPFFDAEVGSGKSLMSLYVVAALSPSWREQTVAELRRIGLPTKVPTVRRTLIVCPPHLLTSWRHQILATLPDARVQLVQGINDLHAEADFFVLSRELAKLGHGLKGAGPRCPGCGAPVGVTDEEAVAKRVRCEARRKFPSRRRDRRTGAPEDQLAGLAQRLAAALRPAFGDEVLVRACLPWRLADHPAKKGRVRLHVVADVLGGVLALLGRHSSTWQLMDWVSRLATAIDAREKVSAFLEETVEQPDYYVAETIRKLREPQRSEADGDDEGGEARALLKVLESLRAAGKWQKTAPCHEPLFGPTSPRRYPLARYILRRCRRRFDALILDEAHEFSNASSAQAKAAHRLTTIPGVPTIALSGSPCNGYASSCFHMWHALSASFRREFQRTERTAFVRRYGFEKLLCEEKEPKSGTTFGSRSDRELKGLRVIGEAPGVAPSFVVKHVLPTCVVLHKEDIEKDLPPMTERPVPLAPSTPEDEALLAEYRRLQKLLLERIRKDRFSDRAGQLLGSLLDLPSYLDRCTDDLPQYVVRYPEEAGGEVIATARMFPRAWHTPKERYFLAELKERLAAGERCLGFVVHTQSGLAHRLLRIVESEVTRRVAYLDASKVSTGRREEWIEDQLGRRGVEVLLTNPATVKTGLNVLVALCTAIWHELDYSAHTWRQANGRLHRYGQSKPVTVLLPYYAGTAQEVAMKLVAKKVSASLQLDGLSIQAALEAAGAMEPDNSMETVLAIGKAVYRQLTGGSLGGCVTEHRPAA